jgi:acyl-CoA dehydrogenase
MSGTDRTMLADVSARLFTDLVTPELIAAAERGEWPRALWQAVEENGLSMPLVPEAKGGAGMTWSDAFVLVMASGRHAVPIPLAETIVASWLLADAGIGVPEGTLTIAGGTTAEPLTARRSGDTWRISGTAVRVPWGSTAAHVVALADDGGTPTVALVEHGAFATEAGMNLAREPRDTLTFDGAGAVAAGPVSLPADAVRLYGALVRSAQMAGALEGALATSVKYVTERKQFGRPIGNFQAIQHQLALLAGHTAASGIAADHAFRAADRRDLRFEVAAAKTRIGEAAGLGASIAHQVHGAIGFTYEHSLHFLTRRLWSWRAEFGAEVDWATWLGRDVAARGAGELWSYVTAR